MTNTYNKNKNKNEQQQQHDNRVKELKRINQASDKQVRRFWYSHLTTEAVGRFKKEKRKKEAYLHLKCRVINHQSELYVLS